MIGTAVAGPVAAAADFAPAVNYSVGVPAAQPTGIASADLDQDGQGFLDLATANRNGRTVSELVGVCDGTFNLHPASPFLVGLPQQGGLSPVSIVAKRLTGDIPPDLATANRLSTDMSILSNNGAGTFSLLPPSPTEVGSDPRSIAAADFDLNADLNALDLAVANFGSGTVTVLVNNGAGDFSAGSTTYSVGNGPIAIGVGNFDDMNGPDMAVVNRDDDEVIVLLNDGAGIFPALNYQGPFAVGNSPRSIAVADVNDDTFLDLLIANYDDATVTVLINDGTGNFTEHASSPFAVGGTDPRGIVSADFDGDGDMDLAVSNQSSNDVSVLINDGAGDFSSLAGPFAVATGPFGLTVGDFDGDGDADVATANVDSADVSVLLNTLYSAEVTFPTAGTVLNPGQTIDITWTPGFRGDYVRIQLWKDGRFERNISNGTGNDGLFSWTVPDLQASGTDYFIKIFALDCHTQTAFSDVFAIEEPAPPGGGPMVTFPTDPGVSVARGDTIKITYGGFSDAYVRIQLWKGTTEYVTRVTDSSYSANTGSYQWTVPSWMRTGTNYFILVKGSSGTESDFSDNPFEIK